MSLYYSTYFNEPSATPAGLTASYTMTVTMTSTEDKIDDIPTKTTITDTWESVPKTGVLNEDSDAMVVRLFDLWASFIDGETDQL